jgi:hypothetical protein
VGGLTLPACEDHSVYFAREPAPYEWSTFGEEVYRLVIRAAASSPEWGDARRRALAVRHDSIVEAADLVLPESLVEPARAGLGASLVRIDDGSLPRLTRGGGQVLATLAADAETLAAITALRDQPWTASRRQTYELLRHVASARSPSGRLTLVELAAAMLEVARAHDGTADDGAPSPGEPAQIRELGRALGQELAATSLEDRSEAARFGESVPAELLAALGIPYQSDPIWVVRADPRGLPEVQVDPETGSLLPPFVDTDLDGLADADAQGRFIDAAGRAIEQPAYGVGPGYSSDGRAIAPDGRPLYAYVDFADSAAGVVLRGVGAMVEDRAHDELTVRLESLLGPRSPSQDPRDGTWYQALDPARIRSAPPAFDLAWALVEAVREFPPDLLLYGADELVRQRRGEVLDLLEEGMEASDVVSEVGLGELAPHNSLLDDLLVDPEPPGAVCYGPYDESFDHDCREPPGPLVPRLIESGILRDLVDVLDDPALDGLAAAIAAMMSHRDRVTASNLRLDEPVDPGAAETVANRSTFQRMLHLVHDSNDAHFDTWLGAIGLTDWRIENLAVFYLQSYCGEARLPSGLHAFLSEFSSDTPTPSEVARFITADQSGFPIFDNPVGREGHELWTYNADSLLAIEASGLEQALRPILRVFCDHGELLLFANILSVLHEHFSSLAEYTTDMTARYGFYGVERPAGLRTLEPGLAAALSRTEVLDAVRRLLVGATEIEVDGQPLVEELIALIEHLLDPAADVALRTHEDPSRDTIYRFDRLEEVRDPSHAHVVLQRAAELGDAWDGEDEAVRDEATAISDLLSEYALDLPDDGETRRDDAEYIVQLAERSLPIIADWARQNLDHASWQDEVGRTCDEVDRLERRYDEAMRGPLLPAIVDLLGLIRDDPEAREATRDLLLFLLTPSPDRAPGDPLTALARVLAAALQASPERRAVERVLRFVGTIVDPTTSPVGTAASDLALLTGASPDSAALQAVANAFGGPVAAAGDGSPPVAVIAAALAAIGRAEPGAEGPLDQEDLAVLLGHGVRLLGDTRHGLERIYGIVGERVRE